MTGRLHKTPVQVALASLVCLLVASLAYAGGLIRGGAVGGVSIDTEGLLSNPTPVDLREVQTARQEALDRIPAELDDPAELRFVSLKKLEQQIADHRNRGESLPDAVVFLAGLQRVKYVLVDREQGDIILAGPAEGWRIDSLGNAVGATSGRPVLLLDDLMVALRAGESSRESGISCSIDPTAEGLARAQQVAARLRPGESPQLAARKIEEALGEQVISVKGVPLSSHFARTIVAADFRMKRLAMDFEPAPVDGLPSYLEMASAGRGGMQNMLPRWWLAPGYEPLGRDADGLVWELRGQGVKCLTEEDFVASDGGRQQTGRAGKVAQRWADAFTERFEELANEDSSFGHLRNAMDLAVVGALLAKEELIELTGVELPRLMGEEALERFNAPSRVASRATFVKKRGATLISASGGVQIYPWQIADVSQVDDSLADTVVQKATADGAQWWWQP